jgi:hypothetical protein
MNVLKTICGPFLKRLAQKALVGRNRCGNSPEKGRFTVADLDRIFDQTWGIFDSLCPTYHGPRPSAAE